MVASAAKPVRLARFLSVMAGETGRKGADLIWYRLAEQRRVKPAIAPPHLETLYKHAGLVVKASLKFARLLLVCLKTRVDIEANCRLLLKQ